MDLEVIGYGDLGLCSTASGREPVVGSHKRGYEPTGPVKYKEFLDQLSEY
jgi:hypothetical protein